MRKCMLECGGDVCVIVFFFFLLFTLLACCVKLFGRRGRVSDSVRKGPIEHARVIKRKTSMVEEEHVLLFCCCSADNLVMHLIPHMMIEKFTAFTCIGRFLPIVPVPLKQCHENVHAVLLAQSYNTIQEAIEEKLASYRKSFPQRLLQAAQQVLATE